MSRSDAMPKFLGTTAINMPGSIAKDQALTKLFGVVGGAAKVPAASFALFTVRDIATMAAAFTLPSPMSAKVSESDRERFMSGGWKTAEVDERRQPITGAQNGAISSWCFVWYMK